jgi:LysM repeat protein
MIKTRKKTQKNTQVAKKKLKGGVTGKGFDVRGQPSSEAKKKGWEKRKNLWYWIETFSFYTIKKLMQVQEDIEANPHKYTVYQGQALQYVSQSYGGEMSIIFDHLDRTEGRATQKIENSGELNININKKIVETKDNEL